MSKRTIITSLALIVVGIIFGAILVSNIGGGVVEGLAGEGTKVKLGGPAPLSAPNQSLKAMSDNFVAAAKGVTPSVVAIEATSPGDSRAKEMPRDFFHFFNPDQDPGPSRGYGSGVIITAD
jgi:S1-C subfamily serine protease